MKKVLIAAPISNALRGFLESQEFELLPHWDNEVVGIITSNKLKLDSETLQRLPHIAWIARLGSGMEIIDTVYCKQHGIHCFSSPKGIANAVAEHAMGMLLSLLHHIPRSFEEIKQKHWIREANRGSELENLRVGIIGYGYTGSALAKKLSVFSSQILVYDKYKEEITDSFVQRVTLNELQSQSDVISFHVPWNQETHHYYDNNFLAQCGSHILINTSRGAVCSTETILAGLHSGKIQGACLDVLEEEKNIESILQQPQNSVEQLLHYPVLITPHIAGYSVQAIEKMSAELMEQIQTVL